MTKPNRWIAAGLGIAISLIFLWFAFRGLRPAEVWAVIQEVQPGWLVIGALWYFVAVTIISLRWRFLLRAFGHIPLRRLVPLVCIGYAGNNIYPFRGGEILRIVLLQRNHGVPLARGTTTVIVERVFDGLVMLTFILAAVLLLDVSSPEVRAVAATAAPLFLGALAVFLALAARPNLLRALLCRAAHFLPQRLGTALLRVGEDMVSGLEGLRTPADLAGTVVSSYLTWTVEASVYWLVSFAFNLNLSYPVTLLVVGVVNLAGLIPASPGQFGVFEFFVATVLVAVGAPSVAVHAYALVVHMVIWLPVTALGLFFLLRQGLGLSAVARAQRIETAATSTQ
ncbi:MAG: lysylphosphatidylglycerol synthase transmembrane domain-containing protein [Aggregatilineales bacterium]